MISLVYLTDRTPSKLADDLILAGYRVFEVSAISEVFCLCRQERVDLIVIDPGVQSPGVIDLQRSHITIRLTPEATAKHLIWELSQLFSKRSLPLE